MRMGPLEIGIILVIILIIFGASKMTQVGQNIGKKIGSSSRGQNSQEKAISIRHPRLQIFGILTVLAGAALMAISLGLLKAIAPYTIWGGVIIAIGVTTVIIARRR